MLQELTVFRVAMDPQTQKCVVLLANQEFTRLLPIWIGPLEATAIALPLEGVQPPRPLTHDLLSVLLEKLGAKLSSVVINGLREDTFFSHLVLEAQKEEESLELDSRPSDAIALALRSGAPIMVSQEVMEKASIDATPEDYKQWEEHKPH